MKCIHTILSLIAISFGLNGCSDEEPQRSVPVTDSEALNQFLSEAPLLWLNLDEVAIDTIIVPTHQIHDDVFVSEDLYVGKPVQITVYMDKIITIEFSSTNIVASKKDGTPIRKIGREGRGPGEFQRPVSVMTDEDFLFIYDDGLKRISKFDETFDLVEILEVDGLYSTLSRPSMNQTFLITQNSVGSGFHAPADERLVHVRPIENLNSIEMEVMPRIIPTGMQPGAYNNAVFSIHDNSDFVVAYPALPYVFVYRDFEHVKTIVLESDEISNFENPSLRPTNPVGSDGVRVSGMLRDIDLVDNGDLFIRAFTKLYHLKLDANGIYHHHKTYIFVREDTGEQIRSIQSLDYSRQTPNRFFAVGWEMWFSFDLN